MTENKKTYAKDIMIICAVVLSSILIFLIGNQISEMKNIGYLGVFFLSLLSNSTVLLPSPGLTVIISASQFLAPGPVAVVGAIGTSMGEFTGYYLGRSVSGISEKAKKWSDFLGQRIKNTDLLIFLLALLPLPFFDVAGIYAGSRKMSPPRFFFWCFVGKLIKMLVYAFGAASLLKGIL